MGSVMPGVESAGFTGITGHAEGPVHGPVGKGHVSNEKVCVGDESK